MITVFHLQNPAKAFKSELHLLSVIPTFGTLAGEQAAAGNLMPATTQAFLDMKEENVGNHLQEHVESLRNKGLNASAEIARGDPASVISKAAENMDLIILSTHRRKGMGAFWARSVAPKVAQKTKIPLLLIPLSENE